MSMQTGDSTRRSQSRAPATKRDIRALRDAMAVVEDDPRAFAESEVAVYSDGDPYFVNLETASCTCEDHHYRTPDGGCKHVRRARYALEVDPLPPWVADESALDDQLRRRLQE